MEARRFAVDSKLEIWVEDQNINKGINPASANVIREARDARHAAGLAVPTSQRQWLRRWRARRGLRLRAFAPLEPLERAEMHEKAADQARSRFGLHRSRCFGHTVGQSAKKGDRFPVLILRPPVFAVKKLSLETDPIFLTETETAQVSDLVWLSARPLRCGAGARYRSLPMQLSQNTVPLSQNTMLCPSFSTHLHAATAHLAPSTRSLKTNPRVLRSL